MIEILNHVIIQDYESHTDDTIEDCEIIIENNTKLTKISFYHENAEKPHDKKIIEKPSPQTTLTFKTNVKVKDTIRIYVQKKILIKKELLIIWLK